MVSSHYVVDNRDTDTQCIYAITGISTIVTPFIDKRHWDIERHMHSSSWWKSPKILYLGLPLLLILGRLQIWRLLVELCLLTSLTLYGLYCITFRTRIQVRPDLAENSRSVGKFSFLSKSNWKSESQRLKERSKPVSLLQISEYKSINAIVNEILDLILAIFIESWYSGVTVESSFPNSVRGELQNVLHSFKTRICDTDVAELLVLKLLPVVNRHFRLFHHSSLRRNGSYSIESKLNLIKSSANSVHSSVTLQLPHLNDHRKEKAFLRELIASVLPFLLSTSNGRNLVVASIAREVLSSTILANIVEVVSEGDFVNQMIVKFMGDSLQRRSQVRRLRAALEQQTRISSKLDSQSTSQSVLPGVSGPFTNARYQHCLHFISSASISELKRLHGELQKSSASNLQQDLEQNARLSHLISLVEQRIVESNAKPSLHEILNNSRLRSQFAGYLREKSASYLLETYDAINQLKLPLDNPDTSTGSTLAFADYDSVREILERFVESDKFELLNKVSIDTRLDIDILPARDLEKAKAILLDLEDAAFQELKNHFYPQYLQTEMLDQENHRNMNTELTITNAPLDFTPSLEHEARRNSVSAISPAVFSAVEETLEQIINTKSQSISASQSGSSQSLNLLRDVGSRASSSTKLDQLAQQTRTLKRAPSSRDQEELFNSFNDELSGDDSDNSDENTQHDSDESDLYNSDILRAAPGDLSLSEKLSTIDKEIQSLREQNDILAPLIKKSELTNNLPELSILKRSKQGLDREIASKEFQKQHWIVQENENSLFGKSKIRISSYMSETKNGSDYVLYIIEVQKYSNEDPLEITAGWVVARRFSQFYQLNKYLRRRIPKVSSIKFPTKTVLSFQKNQVLELRKRALEQYLQQVLEIPEVCSDPIFRSFLSSENFLFNAFKGPRSRLDEMFGLSSPAMNSHEINIQEDLEFASSKELLTSMKEMRTELRQFDEAEKQPNSIIPFVKPISEVLIEVFELGSSKSWVRGRAILVLLQQVLGSAIEKKLRFFISSLLSNEPLLLNVLNSFKDTVFPGGKFKDPPVLRSEKEQAKTRAEAKAIFEIYMEETCGRIFGASNTKHRSTIIFELIQNDYLNKLLVLQLIEIAIGDVFPETTTT